MGEQGAGGPLVSVAEKTEGRSRLVRALKNKVFMYIGAKWCIMVA